MKNNQSVRVAVVQAAPVIMNREATLEKIVSLTNKAAKEGGKIVLFPEAFVPAYPRGLSFKTAVGHRGEGGRKDWRRYWENAVTIPSKTTDILGKIAKENEVYLTLGIVERDQDFSETTLYCTMIYFGPNGELLGKHRKLKPTGSERIIWGEGDGSTLTVIQTPFGKMGGLICWENYMPLARMAMYGKGVKLYLAPTADARETWQATIRHIALEGRCFVLACNQFVTKDMYPKDLACYDELDSAPEIMCRGGSAIVGPLGQYIVEPVYDQEKILLADLDLKLLTESGFDFDVVGHYSRPDIFQLIVNEQKQENVKWLK
ncbi:MAG: nitrilase [Candidatus Heimdallarchaeota archaeon]|nr:nitrilase [Candidatus Heimdallarchaeota archaeon]